MQRRGLFLWSWLRTLLHFPWIRREVLLFCILQIQVNMWYETRIGSLSRNLLLCHCFAEHASCPILPTVANALGGGSLPGKNATQGDGSHPEDRGLLDRSVAGLSHLPPSPPILPPAQAFLSPCLPALRLKEAAVSCRRGCKQAGDSGHPCAEWV